MAKDFSVYGNITNYPCSLVMSGVESDAYFDIAIGEGIDRMLMSYHYIQRKGKNFVRNRLKAHPHIKLMIDSGAYTFINKEDEYSKKPMEFWENYCQKYMEFAIANKDYIFSVVELDISGLIGEENHEYLRRTYFEPLKEHGILVCYVWHEHEGINAWEEMCAKYDYVGFSLATNADITEKDIARMSNIARRYGALIHGFAITRTELMSKIPFFTGDSTTWLVGTQYGELNWFDGRKMKRLKKDKWKHEYKQKYIKIGANWDLAGEENPYELIRINLIVFKQAEDYIRRRIRGKSYWIEGDLVGKSAKPKVSLRRKKKPEGGQVSDTTQEEPEVIPEGKESKVMGDKPISKFDEFQAHKPKVRDLKEQLALLPSIEWFDEDTSDYTKYVEALGLNTNGNDEEYVVDFLYNACVFLVDTDLIDTIEDENLISVAEFYTGRDFESVDNAVEALVELITRTLTLESNQAFPKPSTMNMEAVERAKERDDYLIDEEFEMVDVSTEELALALPPPKEGNEMPEVDELDEELNKRGIVAVRDEKGRFVKGQKRVRKPKNIYSDKFPKLACNTCYKAGDCPEYRPDHVCAYDKIFNKFDVRNEADIMDAMSSMVNLNLGRMQRQAMFEIMDGGMADGTVTSMIDQNINLLTKMKQLQEMQRTPVATQHRVINSDGSMQETTTVTNPSGGILSQIFGNPSPSTDDMEETEKPRKEVILEAEVLGDDSD